LGGVLTYEGPWFRRMGLSDKVLGYKKTKGFFMKKFLSGRKSIFNPDFNRIGGERNNSKKYF